MQKLGGPILIIGLVAVVIIAAIAGGVYFVFAGSGNSGLTTITADKNVATHEGLSLSVPPDAVPQDFRVELNSVDASRFLNAPDDSLRSARQALPDFLTPASTIYTITAEGTPPSLAALAIKLDAAPESGELLDLYAWDGQEWKFLPSTFSNDRRVTSINSLPLAVALFHANPAAQVVSTVLEANDALNQTGSAVSVVQVGGLTLQADGTLTGGLPFGFSAGQGYAVMPLLRTPDDNGASLNAMLADINAQRLQIGGVIDLVNNNDFSGVVLDYRGLDPARGSTFSQLVADLASALHQQNKTLAVVVPTPAIQNAGYTTGGYNLRILGEAADVIELPLGDNLALLGSGDSDRMIAWATGQVSRFKLRLLTTTLSADTASDGTVFRLPGSNALSLFGSANLQTDLAAIAPGAPVAIGLNGKVQSLDYDSLAFAPRFTYLDDSGQTRTVHFVTSETLTHQLALSQKHNLGGVTVRDLFNSGNPAGMFDAIVQFKLKNAALTTSGASLSFTVQGANGVVYEATAMPNQPFTWTASDPGQYSIAANFVSSSSVGLGTVDVVVPQATAAITPTATVAATLRPLPTPTPCSGPCPTAAPVPTAAPTQGSVTVTGGGAWGPFELGGQVVHGGIPHAADMHHAGMTWAKVQGHFGDDLGPAISSAHSQGFKILLSVVGSRDSVMDPGYQQQFASYMAGLASQGADALEVWNEPNIDREWPTGQVNGANYAALLKVVYPAIKAANNSTIIISAAPAPTGYFGGSSCGHPNGCDDRNFLTEFVAAGGGNYLDCIGAHYNEGIVSPTEIGTDPRDNYFTRYYATMLTTYSGIFNAARPICFTELGYLTGEGYPDLASTAPGFAWAEHTTIAQQAQWLAGAASLSKANSNVRLMIVFNVDFTVYGSDPQAGYAIIRADGTCPACDALAGVMP